MKAIFSFTHLPFKHLFGHLTIGFLLIGSMAQAQEAFYIYRNDGDFNGFFYDEVIEMRQSKIGVDSIEYDRWVTQEVVLADTIYRIPLAAIDSIGFQQPEIRFNPRVKFMEQEGLCPYVIAANEFGVTFQDLPANLVPQVGDVLIGLPTDSIAKDKYDEGSFSCVVEQVNDNGGGSLRVTGHAVEQLSDVFEQYITVEQIGVDQRGNIHRRIAGCTPDGFPRAKIQQVSGNSELKLIDFESTFTRSWNPTDNSAIELSAQIGLVVKFRAAFNVTWTRFMASLSQDMVIKAKPALAMSVSQGFDFDSGELLPCDEILFPAACPIFGINPIPSLFLRGEGKLEAKLNLPQVRLGIGQHYTIDSNSWFPVELGLHLVPDENKEVTTDMLDLSGQVTLSGYVQTGVKFSGDIFTASWIKKIFRFALGTYLYAGPKVNGEIMVSAGIPTEEDAEFEGATSYGTLMQSQLNVALLSLDLEAKGHFSVFSKEGEKKFFDKNWSFLKDTIVFAPRISTPMDAILGDDQARLRLNVGQGHTLGYCWAEIGIFDSKIAENPVEKIGMFDLTKVTEEKAKEGFYAFSPFEYKKAKEYYAVPLVHVGGFGEFPLWEYKASFTVPPTLSVTPNHFDVPAAGGPITLTITSNTEWGFNLVKKAGEVYCSVNHDDLDTINLDKGIYQQSYTVSEDASVYGTGTITGTYELVPYGASNLSREITITQEQMSLENTEMVLCVDRVTSENGSGHYCDIRFSKSNVTATRIDATHVHVHGSKTDNETSRTCTVDLTFEYVPSEDPYTYGTEYVTGTIHCTCSDPQDANGLPTTVTFDHISSESPNRDISCYMVMGKKGSSNDYTNYHLNIYYTGYPY